MRLNLYGFESSYHVARYNIAYRAPKAHTPLILAAHRRGGDALLPRKAR